MKAVYFFCTDPSKDKVAPAIYEACHRLLPLAPAGIEFDGQPAFVTNDPAGHRYVFVPTREILSHDYTRYLPMLNQKWGDYDIAGVVNWHEGANAPARIFCAHTCGDVPSGTFPAADPTLSRAVLSALDESRRQEELADWSVLPEATHFSGIPLGVEPRRLLDFPVPLIDIEIGSDPAAWSEARAIDVMAHALARVFAHIEADAISALYVGGTHFEPSLREAIFAESGPFAFSHALPNQWVTPCGYDGEAGLVKLRAAAASIRGGVGVVCFHDNLKGSFKAAARALAAELNVPAVNHRRLRAGRSGLAG